MKPRPTDDQMDKYFKLGDCSSSGGWTVITSQRMGVHAPIQGTKTCKTHISVNSESYNVRTDGFLGMQFYVARNHPIGKSLDGLLAREEWDAIDMMFDDIVMVHATPSYVKRKLQQIEQEAYHRGYEDRAEEIRKALGLPQY